MPSNRLGNSKACAASASRAPSRLVNVAAKKKAMEKATTKLEDEVARSYTWPLKPRTSADCKLHNRTQKGISDNFNGSEWTPMGKQFYSDLREKFKEVKDVGLFVIDNLEEPLPDAFGKAISCVAFDSRDTAALREFLEFGAKAPNQKPRQCFARHHACSQRPGLARRTLCGCCSPSMRRGQASTRRGLVSGAA